MVLTTTTTGVCVLCSVLSTLWCPTNFSIVEVIIAVVHNDCDIILFWFGKMSVHSPMTDFLPVLAGLIIRAANDPIVFTITEKAPNRAFSWLKVRTSALVG